MPNRIETTPLSEGDQTWLASTRGIYKNATKRLKLSAFSSHIASAGGYIKSGYPVAEVAGELVPYVSGGTGGAEKHAGFVFNDIPVPAGSADTHANVALVDHGRIRINRLPVAFTPPTGANIGGLFTYETN